LPPSFRSLTVWSEGRLLAVPLFSFHLVKATLTATGSVLLHPPTTGSVPGLRHAECMTLMKLGSPILSPARVKLRHLAVFAAWDSDRALDTFLENTDLGRTLEKGWHVRMEFMRRWGCVSEFDGLPLNACDAEPSAPVVAVTLARLKLSQVPRFVRWGKPVEELVRDHPGTTLALAAMRPPRTISTFSVWRSQREMTDMVHGRSAVSGTERHALAMEERARKDFHHEFTTLRFRPLTERGEWEGRDSIVPGLHRPD
jgi:hypothetical protein